MKKIINLISGVVLIMCAFFAAHKIDIIKANPKTDIAPHVVAWHILHRDNDRFASGFHLKYKGKVYIVTNKHVCNNIYFTFIF